MIKKSKLAIVLSNLETFRDPSAELEQYSFDVQSASTVLWNAYQLGDIEGKSVGDFGCGTGILGIGALLLGTGVWLGYNSTIVFSIGALMFYYLLYKSKLVPQWLSGWGLIGAVLTLTLGVIAMFGMDFQILWVPIGVQEMVLAIYLITKGFNKSAIKTKK